MKRVTRWVLMLLSLLAASLTVAGNYSEGKQYLKLAVPQSTASTDKIEVVELFWYGCPHCFQLEPHIKQWLENKPDDVEFIRLPAILGPGWELLAKAWFTADLLGVTENIHPALFEELHVRRGKINDEAVLRKFFIRHGVSAGDFDKTFKSFAVAVKANNARLMTRRYAITGVPTLVVNGKYSTSGSQAGSNQEIINVLNFLVEQERKLAGSTAGAAVTVSGQ